MSHTSDQADVATLPGAVRFSKTVAESDVYQFAGITGDFYPVHVDAQYAASQPVGERVAHGVLIMGFMSAVAARWAMAENADILSYGYDHVRFVRPVHIGDTITVWYALEQPDTDDAKRIALVEARNQTGDVVAVARHIIWMST